MDDVDRSHADDISRRPKVRVHVASALQGDVQRCAKCGLTLSDYRGAVVVFGSAGARGRGFAVGAHVAVEGCAKWETGWRLEANEVPCDLFERN